MKKIMRNLLLTMACALLAACAVITVNVYFPEKDVKQAYKSLDEMLLKQGGEPGPAGVTPPAVPEPEKKEEPKPQSWLRIIPAGFSLVSEAWAEETVADDLAVELSGMSDVLKAYDEMKARLPELNALRDSGAVGETMQGLVTIRDKTKAVGKEDLVKAENGNRKTVMMGMAKAIRDINLRKQPGVKLDMNQLLGKSSAIYADTKREAARPGWWVQLVNGAWVQK
jgi:uncharacterized protein YdbL (DUF1318 family)